MVIPEVNFEYEAYAKHEDIHIFVTEDAVANSQDLAPGIEGTSNAFCGLRLIEDNKPDKDYEVFARVGEKVVDIIAMDGTDKCWEDVELPSALGSEDDSWLFHIVDTINQPTKK